MLRFRHATAASDVCASARPQPAGSEESIRPSAVGEISAFLKDAKRFQILRGHLLSRRDVLARGVYKNPGLNIPSESRPIEGFRENRPEDPLECNALALSEALLELSCSGDEILRLEAASHWQAPLNVLAVLSIDPSQQVRAKVAENRRTPMHILETLSNDTAVEVAVKAKRTMQAELLKEAGCIAAELPLPHADPVSALKEALHKAS